MSDIPSCFESLPNEILLHLFEYFDARDLFRAFNHLNARLNKLLRSLNYLSLTLLKLHSSETTDYHICASYVYNLILDYPINIDLNRFENLHRLTLLSPTSNQLKQVVFTNLPYLEHLSIGYEHFLFSYYISDLCQKIFSEQLPRLNSCYLFEPRILEIIPCLSPSSQIRLLKMDNIDLSTYKNILSLCPNLTYLQFTMLNQSEEVAPVSAHSNLKRLIIKFQSLVKIFPENLINYYLSPLPNLEHLSIYEINFDVNIREYLNYRWLSSLIENHLPELRRFKYTLHIYGMKQDDQETIKRVKANFQRLHQIRYQSELMFHFF